MRTRDRLVEVLQTTGPSLGESTQLVFAMAVDRLRHQDDDFLVAALVTLRDQHPSPHVSSLAMDCLHYILSDMLADSVDPEDAVIQ